MHKFLFTLLCACFWAGAYAQSSSDSSDLNMIRTVFGKEKKELIQQYMHLSNNEADKFWKLYTEYETARKALVTERLSVIADYAKQYETLTDKSTESIANRALENDLALATLHQKYFKKLIPLIGAKDAAKFLQLEIFIQDTIRAALQTEIPFIDELNNERKEESRKL